MTEKLKPIFPYLGWVKLELFLTLPDTFVLILEAACHVPVFYASDKPLTFEWSDLS